MNPGLERKANRNGFIAKIITIIKVNKPGIELKPPKSLKNTQHIVPAAEIKIQRFIIVRKLPRLRKKTPNPVKEKAINQKTPAIHRNHAVTKPESSTLARLARNASSCQCVQPKGDYPAVSKVNAMSATGAILSPDYLRNADVSHCEIPSISFAREQCIENSGLGRAETDYRRGIDAEPSSICHCDFT